MQKQTFYFLANLLETYIQHVVDPCVNVSVYSDNRFYVSFSFDRDCVEGSPRAKLRDVIFDCYFKNGGDAGQLEFEFEDEDDVIDYIQEEVFVDREEVQNEFDYVANCCLKATAIIFDFKRALHEGRDGMIIERRSENEMLSSYTGAQSVSFPFKNCDHKRFEDVAKYRNWKSKVKESFETLKCVKKNVVNQLLIS